MNRRSIQFAGLLALSGVAWALMVFPSRSRPLPPMLTSAPVRPARASHPPENDDLADSVSLADAPPIRLPHHRRSKEEILLRRLQRARAVWGAEGRSDLFTDTMTRLTRLDPEAAARFAQALPPGGQREEALRVVSRTWSGLDPGSAEAWAAQLPSPSEQEVALTAVCFRIAEDDPARAVQTLLQHGLENASGNMLPDLVQQWAWKDFNAAQSWVDARPDGEPRDALYARLATELTSSSPAEAVRMVTQDMSPGPLQNETAMTVVRKWGIIDLTGATNWVEQFPEGSLRERGLNELAGIAAGQQGGK